MAFTFQNWLPNKNRIYLVTTPNGKKLFCSTNRKKFENFIFNVTELAIIYEIENGRIVRKRNY